MRASAASVLRGESRQMRQELPPFPNYSEDLSERYVSALTSHSSSLTPGLRQAVSTVAASQEKGNESHLNGGGLRVSLRDGE